MSDERELLNRFCLAINRMDGLYAIAAQRAGVSENRLALLSALMIGGKLSQKQLCEQWLIPKTTVNTLVKELEAQGYVQLERMPGKRREMLVSLTDAGRDMAEEMRKPLCSVEEQAMTATLQKFSAEFVDAVERFNDEFQTALEEEYREEI